MLMNGKAMGTSPEELSEELESNDTTLRTVPDIAATATAAEPAEPAEQHADLSRDSYGKKNKGDRVST